MATSGATAVYWTVLGDGGDIAEDDDAASSSTAGRLSGGGVQDFSLCSMSGTPAFLSISSAAPLWWRCDLYQCQFVYGGHEPRTAWGGVAGDDSASCRSGCRILGKVRDSCAATMR